MECTEGDGESWRSGCAQRIHAKSEAVQNERVSWTRIIMSSLSPAVRFVRGQTAQYSVLLQRCVCTFSGSECYPLEECFVRLGTPISCLCPTGCDSTKSKGLSFRLVGYVVLLHTLFVAQCVPTLQHYGLWAVAEFQQSLVLHHYSQGGCQDWQWLRRAHPERSLLVRVRVHEDMFFS